MKNYRYAIRDTEAGNMIAKFETLEAAELDLAAYEAEDKKDGTYTPDFYEIVELKSEYEELRDAALSPDAGDAELAALGDWFTLNGASYWNGEYYEIDTDHKLYPIYTETEPDEYELTGWEIK